MYKLALPFCCAIVLLSFAARAQQTTAERILTVTEKDQDGKYQDDSGRTRKEYLNARIADINSRMQIDINKNAVIQALAKKGNFSLPAETASLLESLTLALKRQNDILKQFRATLQNYRPQDPDPAKSIEFNSSMSAVSTFALNLIRVDSLIKRYYLQDTSKKVVDKIFPAVQRRINEIQTSLLASNKDSSSTIQLGAWMYHNNNFTPVHLTGFDQLPEGEYYVLDRWNVIPTEEQLSQLKDLQNIAKDNHSTGIDIIKSVLKNYISNFTSQLQRKTNDSLQHIEAEVDKIKGDASEAAAISADIENLKAQYEAWISTCQSRIAFYSQLQASAQLSIGSFLLQLNTDILQLNNQSKAILQTLQKTLRDFSALSLRVQSKVASLKQLILDKLSVFSSEIKTANMETLVKSDELNTAVLQFGEEVFQLSMSDLPSQTELDLAYTGARDPGDRLVIKMSSVTGTRKTRTDLETREVSLYRVLPHFEGTVGVVFAHPFRATAIQKQFQMAPYYNLLFKGFWPWGEKYRRRSVLNNTLTDFSWGLHISSPDFNKDDVPELAVGVVLSGFRDYLQIGIAQNIFENVPFWFFGIRLPVPAMNFGGGASVQKLPD